MDFLDHIFLGNSIGSYCIVGGIILLVVLLKRYLSRYIASLLFRITKRYGRMCQKEVLSTWWWSPWNGCC